MLLSNEAFRHLAVVSCYLQVFLLEPLGDNINGNLGNLNCIGRKGVAQQMCFEDHLFAFLCLENHAMQEEAHARRDGSSIKMVMAILEEIRSWGKAMGPSIRRRKRDHRKRLGSAELVMLLEHTPGFFDQPQRLLSNEVIAWCIRLLPFGDETKQVTDTSRAILSSWWGIIDLAHQAIFRDPRL